MNKMMNMFGVHYINLGRIKTLQRAPENSIIKHRKLATAEK